MLLVLRPFFHLAVFVKILVVIKIVWFQKSGSEHVVEDKHRTIICYPFSLKVKAGISLHGPILSRPLATPTRSAINNIINFKASRDRDGHDAFYLFSNY